MSVHFHVGQKVVCVDNLGWEHRLTKGSTYTISAIGVAFDRLHVGLEETPNPTTGNPLQWLACRFRPVVDRKTDISIFTAMLNPSKQGADA